MFAQVKPRVELSSTLTAPAGRSPKHKRIGILSRRRGTGGITRINPAASSSSAPFSLNAALAGTVPSKPKTKPTKKTWDFKIYEDTPEDEMSNLMEHSTCTLDISDDEARASPKGDRDNKENVPPGDYFAATNSSVARRDMMSDESRSPLGDLDAKDFYADGCDASSVIVVPAEEAEPSIESMSTEAKAEEPSSSSHFDTAAMLVSEAGETLLSRTAPEQHDIASLMIERDGTAKEETAQFQIWESESANGDGEASAVVLPQEPTP